MRWSDAGTFVLVYAAVAYYFSRKMARLVLGPVASALGGIALGFVVEEVVLLAVERVLWQLHRSLCGSNAKGNDQDKDTIQDKSQQEAIISNSKKKNNCTSGHCFLT